MEVIKPSISVADGAATTTSLAVAEHFGRRHDNVVMAIRNAINEVPSSFHLLNFKEVFRPVPGANGAIRQMPCYQLTRDGFVYIAMGFTGRDAARWKVAYIEAFNRMEATLRQTPWPLTTQLVERDDGLDGPLFNELLRLLKYTGQAVLLTYLIRENGHQMTLWLSMREIEAALGHSICRQTVCKSAGQLRKRGLITVQPGNPHGYRVELQELVNQFRASRLQLQVLPHYANQLLS